MSETSLDSEIAAVLAADAAIERQRDQARRRYARLVNGIESPEAGELAKLFDTLRLTPSEIARLVGRSSVIDGRPISTRGWTVADVEADLAAVRGQEVYLRALQNAKHDLEPLAARERAEIEAERTVRAGEHYPDGVIPGTPLLSPDRQERQRLITALEREIIVQRERLNSYRMKYVDAFWGIELP